MSAGVAKYRQVADDLRRRINDGEFSPGAQLPAEPVIGEHYGVSRTTVRDAVGALRDEGVVEIEHGRGVFVRPPAVVQRVESQQRLSRARRAQNAGAFLADAAQQGFTPSTSVKISFEPAQEFAELFGISATAELVVRDRVQRADGKPVQLSTSRMPRSLTRGTVLEETNTGPGGTYARLEEMGCELTEFEERLTGGPALPHEQSLLGNHVRAVTRVRRLAYSDTTVVEVNDMTVPADQYEYVYRFPAT